LEREEREVSRELTTLRHRLEEMNRMRVGGDQYDAAIGLQRGRLQLSSWLVGHTDGEADCPICGSHTASARSKLELLSSRLQEVEAEAGVDKEVPASFDREFQRVTTEIGVTTERLRSVQIRKRALSSRSKEASDRQFAAKKAERFVGNIEAALDLHRRLGSDSGLVDEVGKLRERVQGLDAEFREQDVESRKRRALNTVNSYAGRLLPLLDVENPDNPISLVRTATTTFQRLAAGPIGFLTTWPCCWRCISSIYPSRTALFPVFWCWISLARSTSPKMSCEVRTREGRSCACATRTSMPCKRLLKFWARWC